MRSNGYATIIIDSLNHSKHINYFLKQGIPLLKIKREYRRLTLTVDVSYLDAIKIYLNDKLIDYRVSIIASSSSTGILRRMIGFIIGFILTLIASVVFFNSVINVEISPLENVDYEDITKLLSEECVNTPCFKNKIDCTKLKREISKIENVALASVYIKGVILHIDINEELDDGVIVEDNYRPIVAKADCIIEQIIVESGTALVTNGQIVKKGDILIAPYSIIDANESTTESVPAKGSVYARVYLEETLEYKEYNIVTEETGQEECQRIIYFSDKPLSSIKQSNFDGYREEITEIVPFNFPFKIVEIKRIETVESMIYIPFDEVKTTIQEEMLDKMTESLKKDVQILRKWCIINNIMSTYTLKGLVEYVDQVGVIDESG